MTDESRTAFLRNRQCSTVVWYKYPKPQATCRLPQHAGADVSLIAELHFRLQYFRGTLPPGKAILPIAKSLGVASRSGDLRFPRRRWHCPTAPAAARPQGLYSLEFTWSHGEGLERLEDTSARICEA